MSDSNQLVSELFALGAHLGHKKSRVHPRSRRHIYKMVNGTSIIDLTQTVSQLDKAKKFLSEAAAEGKVAVFVATKRTAAQITGTACVEAGIPFITSKWTSGLLTNFDSLMKNVTRMNEMRAAQAAGDWGTFIKHEQTALSKQLAKLTRVYGGIATLTKRPDILVVIDIKKEKNTIKEAAAYDIPVVALTDTNSNPDLVQYPIATNDDSPQVIEFFVKELVNAYAKKK